MPCGSCKPPATVAAFAQITAPDEPGKKLRISGTVYQEDGKTPAPGITLFLYQTDATGHYNTKDDPFNPRIHGWVRTSPTGGYEFATVLPGAYPSHREPAHIHVHNFAADWPEWFNDDFWFADDPLLTPRQRAAATAMGEFGNIVALRENAAGELVGQRKLRLARRPA